MTADTPTTSVNIDVQTLRKASLYFRAINHDFRRRILQLIHKHDRMAVTEIYVKLRVEQSKASVHLGVLREAKLVTAERAGKQVYYTVNYAQIERLHAASSELLKLV